MKLGLFLLVVLISNAIQGITGFAGTVLAMPFSIILLGIDDAKSILNIITILSCLYIALKNYKNIVWKELVKIIPIMFIGVILGEYIYSKFPIKTLLIIYAIFIIAIGIKGLLIDKEYDLNKIVLFIILISAGIIHGMFISGGPLLIIYAVKKLKDKQSFRATLAPVWIFLNTYLLINNYVNGLITNSVINTVLITVPALIVGLIIGNTLYNNMSQKAFLKLSYILLLISGICLL